MNAGVWTLEALNMIGNCVNVLRKVTGDQEYCGDTPLHLNLDIEWG